MRVLLTCRPLAGHYRPMLPLARALAEAGHDVAFASGEPVLGEAEAEGFTAFRIGPAMDTVEPLARRVRQIAASLPPSQVRPFVFTELFVGVELEPRTERPVRDRRAVDAARCRTRRRGVRRTARRDQRGHPVCGAQLRACHPERRHPRRRRRHRPLLDIARPGAAPPRWLLPLPLPRRVPTKPAGARSGPGCSAGHPYSRDSSHRRPRSRGWMRSVTCRSSTSHWAPSTTTISTCSRRCSTASATKR